LPNELCLAGAGSGKTHKVVTESIAEIERGGKVLVVTYTTNNQIELRSRFLKEYGKASERFVVKGLYSFYLEDMIRPYQRVVFPDRIESFFFNADNPHLNQKNRRPLPGRTERLADGQVNPLYYLTSCKTKAHTGLLAKLATHIAKETKNSASLRLKEIYTKVYFDEVQDLVGWDYSALSYLNRAMPDSICCVGDFRQTIYDTTFGQKKPQSAVDKIKAFTSMKFELKPLAMNRRCIQLICEIADQVHQNAYEKTESAVGKVPDEFSHHLGAFVVRQSEVSDYIETYSPMVLRSNVRSGKKYLPHEARCHNFGGSKGLGFDRVLIIPSESQLNFVYGIENPFGGKDSEVAQNKLYVAITRARYSLGFVVADKKTDGLAYPVWKKTVV
jgi:DNA helicase-2/ATP-dependent DNA helicase PcrA